MSKRKRKGHIRWKRVFLVLFIILFIIFTVKLINYIRYNNEIYNIVVDSSAKDAVIRKKYKKLRLYDKTIDLIKSDNVSIVIQDKNTNTYLDSKDVKKNMDIRVSIYNKRLYFKNFPNVKSLFIENYGIVKKSTKVDIMLPSYLTANHVVDVYGVAKNNVVNKVISSKKVKDKITIKTNKTYERYFITYIALDDIKISNSTVNVGDVVDLKIKFIPSVATIKKYEYTNIGDKFMLNKEGKIIAKKAGKGKITIKHTYQDISKTATIKIKGPKEEKKKEEKKEEVKPNIENKDGLTYVNGILIANKTYSVPKDYNPGKLNDEASKAFEEMRKAASKDKITLWIQSGYRSYKTQEELYNNYVKQNGKEKAETFSARPGYSEHQTGFAMDLNIVDSSFEGTKEAIWIEKNCYKYGFIVRYPKGKESITGYKYEPWHIRYLGKDISKKVYSSGLTLEEYLGIDSKYKDKQ